MRKINLLLLCVCLVSAPAAFGQRERAAKPKPIVFAVLNDGTTLEPIGAIDKGELVETVNGGSEPKSLAAFVGAYYKPKTIYNLIFGAASGGTVTIKNSNEKTDCAKNQATITVQSNKAKLKGFVMSLATNEKPAKTASGVRRMPTAAERAEIESLVHAEFTKQNVSSAAVKNMKYYNLTALDADADGKAEMVGSFWTETAGKERNLLFFIAEKNAAGKYVFGYSDFQTVTPDKLMSGDLKDLDELGGELLLDALEYNGDAAAEIFTISKAFEGDNFHVYSRIDGKWSKVFESYNYHCAY